MAQFQYGAFQVGAFQYAAVPAWRCSSVSQFRRHVSIAHAFCLDNNLYINDLQTIALRLCQHDCLLVTCNDSTVFVSSHDNGDLYNALHR